MSNKLADPFRFQGAGVNFKAKIIGIDDVSNARGDLMCQDSMAKLKQTVKIRGDHKRRITVNVSLEGLKIADEMTGEILHKHEVHKISFISRDMADARAFGYIYGDEKKHQFFAIKTQQAAENLVLSLRDLFQTVFELKKNNQDKDKTENGESEYQDGDDDGGLKIVMGKTTDADSAVTAPPEKPPREEPAQQGGLLDLGGNVGQVQTGVEKVTFEDSFDTFAATAPAVTAASATTSDPWGAPQASAATNDPFATPALAPPPSANRPAAAPAQNDPFTVGATAPAATNDPFTMAATAPAPVSDPFGNSTATANYFGSDLNSAFGGTPAPAPAPSGAPPPGLFDSAPLVAAGSAEEAKKQEEEKKAGEFGGLVSLDLSRPSTKNDPFAAKQPQKKTINEMKGDNALPLDLGATDPFGIGSAQFGQPAAPQANPAAPFAGAFGGPQVPFGGGFGAPQQAAPMGGMQMSGFGQPQQQQNMFGNNFTSDPFSTSANPFGGDAFATDPFGSTPHVQQQQQAFGGNPF